MRQTTLILILVISFTGFSQDKNFYDFIVTHENDTIFGKYQSSFGAVTQSTKLIDLKGKSYKIKEKKIKTIKKNGIIYDLINTSIKNFKSYGNDSLIRINQNDNLPILKKEDLIFIHLIDRKLRNDFMVKLNKDTIFGSIKTGNSINEFVIGQNKRKINSDSINYFRKNGFKYYYKLKRKINPYDKKGTFLKLIYDGKVKLFEYTTLVETGHSSLIETHYYIERNDELTLLNPYRFYRIISKILPENKKLLEKIKKREFVAKDIYLIIKYFNEYTEF